MDDDQAPKLLAARIDYFAEHAPTKIYCSIPKNGDDLSEGYLDISYRSYASAIDRAAWWLDRHLGKVDQDGQIEAFAYEGPADLRWLIFFVAAIKVRRKVCFR